MIYVFGRKIGYLPVLVHTRTPCLPRAALLRVCCWADGADTVSLMARGQSRHGQTHSSGVASGVADFERWRRAAYESHERGWRQILWLVARGQTVPASPPLPTVPAKSAPGLGGSLGATTRGSPRAWSIGSAPPPGARRGARVTAENHQSPHIPGHILQRIEQLSVGHAFVQTPGMPYGTVVNMFTPDDERR